MRNVKFIFPFMSCCFCLTIGYTQSEDEEAKAIKDGSATTQVWLDYNINSEISETRSLKSFIGFRTISPNIYNRFIVAPTYHIRHVKPLSIFKIETPIIHSFQLGGGIFYTNYFETPDNFELRLMQGFQIFTPEWKGIFIKNYVRLEQRFQKLFDNSNWSTGLRLRYKASTVLEWKKTGLPFLEGLYLPMSVEFFINITKANRNNDQVRISPGIGYKFNSQWRAELILGYHNSTNTSEDDQTTNDFVLRLRVFNSGTKMSLFRRNKEEQLKDLMEE